MEIAEQLNKDVRKASRKKELLRVNSAFSGMGIYKIKKIIMTDAKYDYKTGCEHRDFHKYFDNIYINPKWKLYAGTQGPDTVEGIVKNSDYFSEKRKIL